MTTTAQDTNPPTAPTPEGPQTMREALQQIAPWEGKPTRGDKLLLGLFAGVPAFYLATMPFRPFLIAKAPVLLEFVVGSKAAIGAAAAYASIGQLPLWLVVVAGIVGVMKFDWIFWLAGRRWGERVLTSMASTPRQQKWVARLRGLPRWALALLVVASRFPGVPGGIIWTLAGLNRMRLGVFLALDAIGAAIIVATVTTAGYLAGERGVEIITMIDNYALWISLGLVVVLVTWHSWRAQKAAKAAPKED